MTLQLVTATGARPLAFSLCELWMSQQDYKGDVRWIIVDDGPERQPLGALRPNWTRKVIRPEPLWTPGENTHQRNMQVAMEAVDPEQPVVFIEDDDYYSPKWLSVINEALHERPFAGEAPTRFYNIVSRRAYTGGNIRSPALAATGFHGEEPYSVFRKVLENKTLVYDAPFWKHFHHRDPVFLKSEHVVSMKSLPGRPGFTKHHRQDFPKGATDHDGSLLRKWVGPENAKLYEDLAECQTSR